MIKLLIVRMSSMGDLIHTWPAITDLKHYYPNLLISWIVEEDLVDIARLHPAVSEVILFSWRRWRKHLFRRSTWCELRTFYVHLRTTKWDIVVDLQGLLKSAIPAYLARAPVAGYSWSSVREPLASLFYDKKLIISRNISAINRNRQLCGKIFGYEPKGPPIFGVSFGNRPVWLPEGNYAVLLHATSRASKQWPESYWIELANWLWSNKRIRPIFPWGNQQEQERAARFTVAIPEAIVTPRLSLNDAAAMLGHAVAVVGVDTGLTHLANAVNVPLVAIYTDTDSAKTGVVESCFAINLGNIGLCPTVEDVLNELIKRWNIE